MRAGLAANIQPVKMRRTSPCSVTSVDFQKHVGVAAFGRRARVAGARHHLQRAELHRLVDGDVEIDDAAGDLVETGKHRLPVRDFLRRRLVDHLVAGLRRGVGRLRSAARLALAGRQADKLGGAPGCCNCGGGPDCCGRVSAARRRAAAAMAATARRIGGRPPCCAAAADLFLLRDLLLTAVAPVAAAAGIAGPARVPAAGPGHCPADAAAVRRKSCRIARRPRARRIKPDSIAAPKAARPAHKARRFIATGIE